MRVASKVATGTGVILALLIGVLAYHVSLIRDLASANRDLGAVRIHAAMVSLELLRQLDRLEEYTRKFFVTRDTAYAEMVGEARDAFVASLEELKPLKLVGEDAAQVSRLVALWQGFRLVSVPRQEIANHLAAEDQGHLLEELAVPIEGLRRQAWAVITAIRAAIASQVAASAATSRGAERVSLLVIGAAVALSVLILIVTVRSIKAPLTRLTEATRSVAQGEFSFHLDDSRGDEFASLAADFNTMVRRLGELDQLKREFVSHVSHELKTPLVAMQETNQLLLEGTPGELTPKQRRLLDLNLASSKRLFAMIANLLDLSRIEAGAMDYEIEPHNLVELVDAAVAMFEARARDRRLKLGFTQPPHPVIASCDGDRIIQVISNLLDNAVKFSPDGSIITVAAGEVTAPPASLPAAALGRLAQFSRSHSYAMLSVADLGPGVADAHKERIFEKFHQVGKGRRRADAGVGLGLAICREIVEAHGGAVWVADNPGGGSVFAVLLPADTPPADRRRSGASRPERNVGDAS